MTVAAPALAQTMHALQIRGSVTTGLISVCCPCQADPIDTRSPDRWKNDDGRVETVPGPAKPPEAIAGEKKRRAARVKSQVRAH